MNSESLKTSDITEPPVQDPLVTQIGECFEKFADALGQHMTTLSYQISNTVINAINTFNSQGIDKEKGTEKRTHSSRAKASKEDEEPSRRKCQNVRNNYCRDKSKYKKKEREGKSVGVNNQKMNNFLAI